MRKSDNAQTKFSEVFAESNSELQLDNTTLQGVLEDSLRSVIAKTYGSDENYSFIINPAKGDFEIHHTRTIVPDGEVEDANSQISLSEARKVQDDFEVGEEIDEIVDFASFGRRMILNLRQTFSAKLNDLRKDILYQNYSEKIGQIVAGEVYQTWKRETLLIDEDGNDMLLPKAAQIPGEEFRKGDMVRCVVDHIDNENNNPKIYVSRTSPVFLQRLMEIEIPEIADGLITIKAIARVPGQKAKVAVESYDDHIDAVGACVGMQGARIRGVGREICNENIDVINWTNNVQLLIKRSLAPASISSLRIDEETKSCNVYLEPAEVSKAIGKNGSNIKCASLLTGYKLDVYREMENPEDDDIYLEEFKDVIDEWIIDILKQHGMNTAKQVLAVPKQELLSLTDLEEETVDDIYTILNEEFEDEQQA
ncbi:MAG: transcription termination/antitermination protein NusA [Paludibacteraceae bacterium]|nr:transcription termination/antitermination protein NusA [Paludibacteraceae bacterium]MCR4619912.1 transcription termination factor NusA [Paludibacteraceae bacterium]